MEDDLKTDLCTSKDKGLFHAAMCRERGGGGLPRTKSNISSFVERSSREREREREKKAANGSEEKERNILEGNEMQMYSLHGKVNGRKCAEGQPPSATGDYIYTHETPEFKVEVNYLAKDLRLGRHLPSMTLAPRGPPPVSFFALILDRWCAVFLASWKLSIAFQTKIRRCLMISTIRFSRFGNKDPPLLEKEKEIEEISTMFIGMSKECSRRTWEKRSPLCSRSQPLHFNRATLLPSQRVDACSLLIFLSTDGIAYDLDTKKEKIIIIDIK